MSSMFSHLRIHKRSGSNPSSPNPPSSSGYHASPLQSPAHESTLLPPPTRPYDADRTQTISPVSQFPPILPPIPRVASQDKGFNHSRGNSTSAEKGAAPTSAARSGNTSQGIRRQPSTSSPPPYNPNVWLDRPSSSTDESQKSSGSSFNTKGIDHRFRGQERERSPSHAASRSVDASYLQDSENASPAVSVASAIHSLKEPNDWVRAPEKQTQSTQQQPQKAGKRKLALGNPMSLLMRRRSTQALERLSDESLVSTTKGPAVPPMAMPDNYDPRIRGKFVHDFSAPRPRRNFSYNDLESQETASRIPHPWTADSLARDSDPRKRRPQSADHYSPIHDREHTPVFHENFEDDSDTQTRSSAIRAEELANSGFLARHANLVSEDEPDISPPPQTRKQPPPPLSLQDSGANESLASTGLSFPSQLPTVVEASPVSSPTSQRISLSRSPPQTRSRASSATTDTTHQPTRQPKHHTSNASRFSFQMMDKDSIAQEQLLEEKHRQHEAKRQKEQQLRPPQALDPYEEGTEEMDDYDDMNDDGGFYEEAIPGVNADVDEDDFDQGHNQSSLAALGISLSNMAIGGQITPLSASSDNVKPLSLPNQHQSETIHSTVQGQQLQQSNIFGENPATDSANIGPPLPSAVEDQANELSDSKKLPNHQHFDLALGQDDDIGDDMYFDDGLIDDPIDNDDANFDESIFDDPNHPLYERKPIAKHTEDEQPVPLLQQPHTHPLESNDEDAEAIKGLNVHMRAKKVEPLGFNAPQNSVKDRQKSENQSRVASGHQIPQNEITAYHNALAEAAQRAAADGKFNRHNSVGSDATEGSFDRDEAFGHSSRPSLVPDDGRFSGDSQLFTPAGLPSVLPKGFDSNDYETDDYDSGLEDDPIIAEANAEALASDDAGFYGQEFGFYAQPYGSTTAQFANGGFFGPRDVDALGRSISGRNAVREPNLTPITERSEFSTRNSFIGISHWGPPSAASAAIPSPGLAQLARLSPYTMDEDEMTLSQLMKLRRGAFGGSNGSLQSSSSSPNYSSPVAAHAPPSVGSKVPGSSPMYPSASAPGILGLNYHGIEAQSPATTSGRGSQSLHGESPLALGPIEDEELLEGEGSSSPSPSPLGRDSPTVTLSTAFAAPPPPIPEQSSSEESEDDEAGTMNSAPVVVPLQRQPPSSASPKSLHPLIPSAPLSAPLPSPLSPTLISPTSAGKKTHSRSGSATADRLTYVHEGPAAENGFADRWVLERRRTAETGELELVGREIVSGGRI
ncbi:MAG: hypothetical protein M1820_006493 [Bogoriella megaspora]|nr:MAG: hypothetical protein M1820_006493 [Bogoriella megaspora]